MQIWTERYRKIDHLSASDGVAAWLSPAIDDPWWDDFLRRIPCGQYQQSSLWAEYKAAEAWQHHRVILTGSSGILGGFQLLWKKTRLARVGYVSKGPVAHPESPMAIQELLGLLMSSAKELRLSAVVLQQPDETQVAIPPEPCWIECNPLKVIESTYVVDVSVGMDEVRRRMHPKLRQYARKAKLAGARVRVGTEADLPLFFNLMSETCRRQNTEPNPGTLESLRRLWQVFARANSVEMAFANRDGVDCAGRLNLVFGDRVTQWKKGWDGTNPAWHPNELLVDHALEWANARGHRVCDFAGINRAVAMQLLAGRPVDDSVARSRDMFNLRLGGSPRLLPRARLYLPNPILRYGFRHLYPRLEHLRERRQPGSLATFKA
ncbi:MAG TPA: GNAT family N-acetyltransferase [Lacunisphaera sp.]|nr:GNAT family N-acetyltransferase [Lacunisphaera sp.]